MHYNLLFVLVVLIERSVYILQATQNTWFDTSPNQFRYLITIYELYVVYSLHNLAIYVLHFQVCSRYQTFFDIEGSNLVFLNWLLHTGCYCMYGFILLETVYDFLKHWRQYTRRWLHIVNVDNVNTCNWYKKYYHLISKFVIFIFTVYSSYLKFIFSQSSQIQHWKEKRPFWKLV